LLPRGCPSERGWYLGAGSRRCWKDFAAHLDSPGSALRAGEATALAQPRQDLRRPECIPPGIVPILSKDGIQLLGDVAFLGVPQLSASTHHHVRVCLAVEVRRSQIGDLYHMYSDQELDGPVLWDSPGDLGLRE